MKNLATALSAQIQISIVLIGMVRKPSLEPIILAKRWDIIPEKAWKTIQAATQRVLGLCPILHCQNDSEQMTEIFIFAQVYATDFGWARTFLMASKSKACETLSSLFAQDGALPAYIYNNAKEMIQGKLSQELKNVAWNLKQLEPYTP